MYSVDYDQQFLRVKDIHQRINHPLKLTRGNNFPDGTGVQIAIIDEYKDKEPKTNHMSLLCNDELKITIFDATKKEVQEIRTCENISDHALQCTAIAVGEAVDGAYLPDDGSKKVKYKFPGGVAPKANATLYLVDHSKKESTILALQDIVKNGKFDVLSLSIGNLTQCKYEKDILDILTGTPTVIVVAAGNYGNAAISSTAKLVDKANFVRKRILSVGGLNAHFKIANYSPKSKKYVTIYQPCEFFTPISDPKGGDKTLLKLTKGTSMSTPAVAGIICLLIQCCKKHESTELSKPEIVNLLKNAIQNNPSNWEIGAYNEIFLKRAFNEKDYFERGCATAAINNN